MTMRTSANTWQIVKPVRLQLAVSGPPGHLLQPPPEQVSDALKGKKIAYKFEIEQEVGTFKCVYKGKNGKYKGHATASECVLWSGLHHVLRLGIESIRHGSKLGYH